MDTVNDRPGVLIATAGQVREYEDIAQRERDEIDEVVKREHQYSSIANHIIDVFQKNKDARVSSRIEDKMLQSLRAYNGHYDPEDIARIKAAGGSDIYMNLTPTKCRAAMSWLRDIYLAAKEKSFLLESTPIPDLPKNVQDMIRKEVESFAQSSQGTPAPQQPNAMRAAQRVMEANKLQSDIEEAISDEIYQLANKEIKKFETIIADQLIEGNWEQALTDFIEDFCVFQVAVMKGPIITKKKRLKWINGRPEATIDYIFLNKRVSPLDIYPAPSATNIEDGDLCEHMRFSRSELYDMIGVQGYKDSNIRRILERADAGISPAWFNTYIEDEKVVEEYRGDTYRANQGVIHGIHYHGSLPQKILIDWGYSEADVGTDPSKEFEVEAILAGDEVIKCEINDDPLLRRPYYKASFQSIPGSWWGRSLPELMRDIQRMCNATARALANNMGVASGPQIELYIDRLAADEEIDAIHPLKIWQLTSDPTGAGGRAVQFWQPSSNAAELLAVYEKFEMKADDATGIPRYAYSNDRAGSAAQTATGLSMLLETANKGIKDAARYIDLGLIKPRVEYQFYWNLLSDEAATFTGDVNVVAKGSQALTMKGSQELRRNEFLGILANPTILGIVGIEGVADILREMAKSLGLGDNIIPSKVELRKRQEEERMAQQQAAQAEAEREARDQAVGVQQVQMQTQQAEMASQRSAQIKVAEIQQKAMDKEQDRQVQIAELQQKERLEASKNSSSIQKQQMSDQAKADSDNKHIALSLKSGFRDKTNNR